VNLEVADLWQRALRALRTAEILVDEDPDAAASRAYYAAFYAVSALFAFDQRSFSKHSGLESAVHRDLVKSGTWPAEAGAAFSWLATLRHTGDYGGDKHVQPTDAQTAVDKARLVLRTVRATAPQPLPDS
jgi:uncharacterized protein (UPF0332 family)